MSLLSKASLVVTPNVVKVGKLYSVKPTDGSGDMTVVRATSATRVNEQGLVEIPRTNLLLRSEEFDNASWIKADSTVTANATTSPSGTMTADKLVENNTNSRHYIYQPTDSLVVGNTYFVSVYLKDAGRNRGRVRAAGAFAIDVEFNLQNGTVSGPNAIIQNVGNGWYKVGFSFIANATTMGTVIFLSNSTTGNSGFNYTYLGDNTSGLFLWGAQLEVDNAATEYIPTTSVIRTRFAGITQDGGSASNIPRLDYTNATCPSILVEPQRTNLVTYSEQFDNAVWSSSMIRNANATISPSGTMTADLLQVSGGSGSIYMASTITNSAHSFSVYAKKGNWDIFRIINGSSLSNVAWFNLTNGTTSNVIGGTSQIIDVGNGWYRCIYNTTTPNTTAGITFALSSAMGSGAPPSDGSNIFIWGAQLEAGANATSYIPTVASAVTRNADVISKTGISSLINSNSGCLYINFSAFTNRGLIRTISLSDGTNNNQVTIDIHSIENSIFGFFNVSGIQFFSNVNNINQTNYNKILIRWAASSFSLFVNSIKVFENTTYPNVVTNLFNTLKFSKADNGRQLEGNLKEVLVFPTALTDQECIALTTL